MAVPKTTEARYGMAVTRQDRTKTISFFKCIPLSSNRTYNIHVHVRMLTLTLLRNTTITYVLIQIHTVLIRGKV